MTGEPRWTFFFFLTPMKREVAATRQTCDCGVLLSPPGERLYLVSRWHSSSHCVQGRLCVSRLSQRAETLVL